MTTADPETATAPKADPSPQLKVVPMLPASRWLRVFFFFSSALLLTGLVSMVFADLLWRTGWSTSRTILLVLFVLLFSFSAIGSMHGVFGFFLRLFGDKSRLTQIERLRHPQHRGHQHRHHLPHPQRRSRPRLRRPARHF